MSIDKSVKLTYAAYLDVRRIELWDNTENVQRVRILNRVIRFLCVFHAELCIAHLVVILGQATI